MNRFLCIFLLVMALFSLASCTESADLEPETRITVEGWIDSDGYPIVLLSRALKPSATPTPITDAVVKWGRVTISDGSRTEVMTGSLFNGAYPQQIFTCYRMQGEVGRTYTITAEVDGEVVTASSTMLSPPQILSVDFSAVSDSLCSASITIQAPQDVDTCRMVVFTEPYPADLKLYPAMFGTVISQSPGEVIEMPLYNSYSDLYSDSLQPYFTRGEKIHVVVAHVEREVYDFWVAYLQQVYFGNNIFLSSSHNLPSNIQGGYGVFSARGVSSVYVDCNFLIDESALVADCNP